LLESDDKIVIPPGSQVIKLASEILTWHPVTWRDEAIILPGDEIQPPPKVDRKYCQYTIDLLYLIPSARSSG
jgi:hypothetical protein